MRYDDDEIGGMILITVMLTGLAIMAPYLGLRAASGEWGLFLTMIGGAYLAASLLSPYIPVLGAVMGAQWALYGLWFVGYFDVVNGPMEAITGIGDPDASLDQYLLGLVGLLLTFAFGLLAYVLVPVAAAAAGGALVDVPSRRFGRARETLGTDDAPEESGDAATPAFPFPQWDGEHYRDADRVMAARRARVRAATVLLWVLIPTALLALFAPALPPALRGIACAGVWLAALVGSWTRASAASAVARDQELWALPQDRWSQMHRDTVDQANGWAAAVHPQDFREGRPLVAGRLEASRDAMYAAQRLTSEVRAQAELTGPGWVPPAQRELDAMAVEMRSIHEEMRRLNAEAAAYYRRGRRREAERRLEGVAAQMREDAAVLEAAAEVYLDAYGPAREALVAHDAAGGLPDPASLRRDPRLPEGVAPGPLPEALVLLLDRAQARAPRRLAEESLRLRAAELLLRSASTVCQAAFARLALVDRLAASPPVVDDSVVRELIDQIRTRSQAQAETEARLSGSQA